MALTIDTGQVAANTGSASTTITVTALGKVIILFTTGQTTNTSDAATVSWSIGFSDATNLRCIAWASDNNVSTSNCGKTCRTTAALEILSNGTPTSLRTVTGVAFTNATTTTLTWDGTPAAAYLVNYMQFGGSDVTNAKVGTHTMANSTGDKTETGVGFQGDFGMFIFSGQTAAGTATRINESVGFAVRVNDSGTSRAKQYGMTWCGDDGQTMAANINCDSYVNTSNFLPYIGDGSETIDILAQFGTSTVPLGFASDGFRYNISNASATNAQLLFYCIIQGGQWDAGSSTMPTADGNRVISGMTFQPTGIFLMKGTATANATVTVNAESSCGAGGSAASDIACGGYWQDATINTQTAKASQNNGLLIAAPNVNTVSLTLTSLDVTGWTANWAGGAATGFQFGWFAGGSTPVTDALLWRPSTNLPIFPKTGLNLY